MNSPGSNRRDFLTGRIVPRELRQVGEGIADALQEAAAGSLAPQAGDTVRLETRAMACSWSVIMNPGPPRQVMTASDALDLVHGIEDQLTVYRDDSEISRVNRLAAASPQPVPDDVFEFLQACQQLWVETEGAFDPASGSLIRLWRDARREGRVPSKTEVEAALACSGMQHVHLDPETRSVSFSVPGLIIDFGAIGKGYAVDRCVAHLDREKLPDYLLHGGLSSVFGRGKHAGHSGWPVGIKNPLFTERRYATLLLCDEGMSTSGSNIQYFRYQGRRYGHILDPRTGWPAEGLLSVTVLAPTAARAEALSTAFYVMGLDKSRAYCDDHPEIGAIFVAPPARGRTLELVVCNLPDDRLFFEESSETE